MIMIINLLKAFLREEKRRACSSVVKTTEKIRKEKSAAGGHAARVQSVLKR